MCSIFLAVIRCKKHIKIAKMRFVSVVVILLHDKPNAFVGLLIFFIDENNFHLNFHVTFYAGLTFHSRISYRLSSA
jgi:L-cystine uptake protein TcyP (sodium:dicarboxylate symporter family)